MFSGLASYIFGTNETNVEGHNEEQSQIKIKSAEDEWEFVEKSSSCPGSPCVRHLRMKCHKGTDLLSTSNMSASQTMSTSEHNSSDTDSDRCEGPRIKANYLENGSDSEAVLSDVSSIPEMMTHPSMSESWLMTPPPCFTAGGSSPVRQLESNPMENLLIEHPSMSVYGPRGRPSSTGIESTASSSDAEMEEPTPTSSNQSQAVTNHHSGRSRVVTAKQQLIEQQRIRKSMQVAKTKKDAKKLSKSQLSRSNIVAHVQSKKPMRRQHFMQLRNSGAVNDRKSQ